MLDAIATSKVIFVTGKGGVGKSTATASLAEALHRQGKKILVAETDTFSAMLELLGAGSVTDRPLAVRENLYCVNLSAESALRNVLTRFVPSDRVVKTITSNRITRAFFDSAPSVNEYVLLDQIFQEVDSASDFDHVIVDLPASGHAVTFLAVPRTLHGMMRGMGPFAKRAKELDDRITSDDSAIVTICLPEEMPVNETIELSENLQATLGRPISLIIANMVHRRPMEANEEDAFRAVSQRLGQGMDPAEILAGEQSDPVVRLFAGNTLALNWYTRDKEYLGLLREKIDAPIIEVPMVYEIDDRDIVDRVANTLLHPSQDAEDLAS